MLGQLITLALTLEEKPVLYYGNDSNLLFVSRAATVNLGAHRFIRKRSLTRWLIHFLIAWGTMIAGAVTFPLVFGWLHFATRLDDPEMYRVMFFGVCVGEFSTHSLLRYVMFNLLNVSAVMVITGVGLSLHRRLRDPIRQSARALPLQTRGRREDRHRRREAAR